MEKDGERQGQTKRISGRQRKTVVDRDNQGQTEKDRGDRERHG